MIMIGEYVAGKVSSSKIGDYKHLEYFHKPFNDSSTIDRWKSIGHHYNQYTGYMRDQSYTIPHWCFDVSDEIKLKKASITLYYMPPGVIMPEHIDTFLKYKQIHNIEKNINVYRAVVFLEDWMSGHYFEIDETPIVNWKKGDYILWKNDVPHMAANIGKENRYTMQIIGIF